MAFSGIRFSKTNIEIAETFYELMQITIKDISLKKFDKDVENSKCKEEILSKLDLDVLKELRDDIGKSLEVATTAELMKSFKKLYMRKNPDVLSIIKLLKNLNTKISDIEQLKKETLFLERQLNMINSKQLAGIYALLKWNAPIGAEAAILSKMLLSDKLATGVEMLKTIQSIAALTTTVTNFDMASIANVHYANDGQPADDSLLKCFLCKKIGHVQKNCPDSTTQLTTNIVNEETMNIEDATDKVNVVVNNEQSESISSDGELSLVGAIYEIEHVSQQKKRLIIEVDIEGKNLIGEADTGSPVTFICREYIDDRKIKPTKNKFFGLGGNEIKTHGKAEVIMKLNEKTFKTIVYIADVSYNIIGLEDLHKAGLVDSLVKVAQEITVPLRDDIFGHKMKAEFSKVCSPELRNYIGKQLKMKWQKNQVGRHSNISNRSLSSVVLQQNALKKINLYKKKRLCFDEQYLITNDKQQFTNNLRYSLMVLRTNDRLPKNQAERSISTTNSDGEKMKSQKRSIKGYLLRPLKTTRNTECDSKLFITSNLAKKNIPQSFVHDNSVNETCRFKKDEVVMSRKKKEDRWKFEILDKNYGKIIVIKKRC